MLLNMKNISDLTKLIKDRLRQTNHPHLQPAITLKVVSIFPLILKDA
jgi:hypothetical protein